MVCVDYEFQSSSRLHQTRAVYEIVHAHNLRTRFFEVARGVEASEMEVERDEMDDYAN